MAMSLVQGPSGKSWMAPVNNPIYFVVSSTNTAQPNFEYICDLYITGVTFAGGASYLRLKTPADPTHGRGVFDIAPILSRYLSGDIGNSIYGFQQCSNTVLDCQPKFGELYGPSSGVVAYPNGIFGSSFTAINGSLDVLENRDYSTDGTYTQQAYVADSSSTQVNFLSNAPSSGTIRSGENQWINVLTQTSGAIKFANINTYTGVGNNKTFGSAYRVINHQYLDPTTTANRMLRFPVGKSQLNNITSSSIYPPTNDGITNMISQLVTAWEVYFTDSAHNRITESYWVILDDKCTQHDVYRLHFKNKWGAYDSFSFIRANQVTTDVKRSQYEKVMGEFKSASSYTYNKSSSLPRNSRSYSTFPLPGSTLILARRM